MLSIIAIFVSAFLGAFAGRIACNLMNKNEFTINPILCTIAGIVGGAIGSWVVHSLFGGDGSIKVVLAQLVAGVGCAILLLLLLSFFRDKEGDDNDFEE